MLRNACLVSLNDVPVFSALCIDKVKLAADSVLVIDHTALDVAADHNKEWFVLDVRILAWVQGVASVPGSISLFLNRKLAVYFRLLES